MTKEKSDNRCPTCGKKKKLTQAYGTQLCPACRNVVELIENSPDTHKKLIALAATQKSKDLMSGDELPDVLDAVRYRTADRERNTWYVSVSEFEGNPLEIFASTAFDRDQHLQSRISNLTTITRLISLILRHTFMGKTITLEKTVTQLRRSSRQQNDLPDMLARVLDNYTTKEYDPEDRESAIP